MAQLRITDSSGSERSTIPIVKLQKEQTGLNVDTLCRITVPRPDLNAVTNLTPGTDRVFVEDPAGTDTFGGILRTPGRAGARPTILAPGFSEYMSRAQPTPTGQRKAGVDDSTLIEEAVDATPQLSKGTINTVTSNQTFIFNGVSQLAKARKVAEMSGGELVFNPDLTVDYVDTRGSDKTGTTLSPANQSFIENTFTVDRDGVAGNTTHLKVYGAGQGTEQIEATIVPADDGNSYANKATYTNPDWSSGDDEIWGRRTNKDLKNVDIAQTWGQTLMADLPNVEVRVETPVKGGPVTVNLGDEFHVENTEEAVDEDLRAVEVTKVIEPDSGTFYETVFSNYSVGHFDAVAEDHKDTGRYRQAFEGELHAISGGPGRGPVDSSHDYIVPIYYPDQVVAEALAELRIKGLNYRAYAGGVEAHTHDVTHPSHTHDVTHPTHDHDVTHPSHDHDVSDTSTQVANTGLTEYYSNSGSVSGASSGDTIDSHSIGSNEDGWPYEITAGIHTASGNTSSFENLLLTVKDSSGPSTLAEITPDYTNNAAEGITGVEATQIITQDLSGITVDLDATWLPTGSQDFVFSWKIQAVPKHTHDVSDTSTTALGTTETSTTALGTTETSTAALGTTESSSSAAPIADPGIEDWDGAENSPAHYPENITVSVNGSAIGGSNITLQSGTDDGTGEFEAIADLSGATFTEDAWNTVSIGSDGLGHLDATYAFELYRQVLR